MGLTDFLTSEQCGLDIYEEPDEEQWVFCRVEANRIGTFTVIPIIVIIVLLLIYFGSNTVAWISGVIGFLAVVGILAGHYYYIPIIARREHRRFQRELKSYTDRGMSLNEAIKELKSEKLLREDIESRERAARQASRSQLLGLGAIAASIYKK